MYYFAEYHYAECRYAECRYAECRYAECRGAVLETETIIRKKLVPKNSQQSYPIQGIIISIILEAKLYKRIMFQ